MKKFSFVGLILVVFVAVAAMIVYKVRSNVQPAQEPTFPSLNESSNEAPELSTNIVIQGLSNVWDVAELPDKTLLITERAGTISRITNGSKSVLLDVPGVVARGEGGLMGMVLDTEFSSNRFVYACYNTANDIRLSRWKLSDNNTALSNKTDIITGMPVNPSGRHSGCRPRFGADRNLWVGTGDVAMGSNPQDTKSLGGKILRVTRDGKAVEGNLGAPFDNRIYSYGHRNTQGMAMFSNVRNGSYGYSVEHGPGTDDEINELREGNFGWDPMPGYNESVPMTDTTKYPIAVEAVWKSGRPTLAPSGATILTSETWGAWDSALAVAMLKDKHVRIFEIQDGQVRKETKVLDSFGRIRSLVMGSEGILYLTTDNGEGEDGVIKVMTN